MNKNYLTVKELADLMRISRVAVFNKIKLGQIKAEKVGRNYIIYQKDLPDVFKTTLDAASKREIEQAVKRVIAEYGDVIRKLGKE